MATSVAPPRVRPCVQAMLDSAELKQPTGPRADPVKKAQNHSATLITHMILGMEYSHEMVFPASLQHAVAAFIAHWKSKRPSQPHWQPNGTRSKSWASQWIVFQNAINALVRELDPNARITTLLPTCSGFSNRYTFFDTTLLLDVLWGAEDGHGNSIGLCNRQDFIALCRQKFHLAENEAVTLMGIRKPITNDKGVLWKYVLRDDVLKSLQTVNTKFGCSMRTDGYSVSVGMHNRQKAATVDDSDCSSRPSKKAKKAAKLAQRDKLRSSVDLSSDDCKVEVVIGVDPGRRALFTAVEMRLQRSVTGQLQQELDPDCIIGEKLKSRSMTGKEYRHRCHSGRHAEQLRQRRVGRLQVQSHVDALKSRHKLMSLEEAKAAIKSAYAHCVPLWGAFQTKSEARRAFTGHILRSKTNALVAERIVGPHNLKGAGGKGKGGPGGRRLSGVAVFFGDASNSLVRGQAPVPTGKGVLKALQDRWQTSSLASPVQLQLVDEFKTSKLCSKCHHEVKCISRLNPKFDPNSPDLRNRRQFLKVFGVTCCRNSTCWPVGQTVRPRHWDRDVNAARNILRLGLFDALGKERPEAFRRSAPRADANAAAGAGGGGHNDGSHGLPRDRGQQGSEP